MSGVGNVKLIGDDGKRIDGRALNELRPIKMEAGVLKRAEGSCYLEWGGNKVIAAVYGPREAQPRHHQKVDRAIVQCRYNMAPFSVDDRKRPGPDRRSIELSKVIGHAFENVILLEKYPKSSVDIFIEVLQADAGTRCAGVAAASVALADAGIPMRSLVAACAAGRINGKVCLDLNKEEDNYGDADLPVGVAARTGEIVLMQMDGDLSLEEFDEALSLAIEGCAKVNEIQRQALLDRYRSEPSSEEGNGGVQ
ncbi:MAG: exosome complex exonuclease Rrp41 [Thermoplasmata archaeon HGW-Thermoplasmata-2]|nr:MAG: exosome complex exonuclease Rrp41 [Thermoplasmata archaeon HGW-Thermoplasmata-2]